MLALLAYGVVQMLPIAQMLPAALGAKSQEEKQSASILI